MAKKTIAQEAIEGLTEGRTEPVTLPPFEGGNTIFAAWDMFYHIFGARADRIIVEDDGVVLEGLTLFERFNLNQIIEDTSRENHRLSLVPHWFWAQGSIPEKPTDRGEIAAFLTAWFGGSGGGKKKTPEYARNATILYKANNEITTRAFKRVILTPVALEKINSDSLVGIDDEHLAAFQALIANTIATRQANA